MPLKNLKAKSFFYEEDEFCGQCGYQEISMVEGCRICIFCGHSASPPFPFRDLVKKCSEEIGEQELANKLSVSTPTIQRWKSGKTCPYPE